MNRATKIGASQLIDKAERAPLDPRGPLEKIIAAIRCPAANGADALPHVRCFGRRVPPSFRIAEFYQWCGEAPEP